MRRRYDSDAEIEDSFAQSDIVSPVAPAYQVVVEVEDSIPRNDYQRIELNTPTRKSPKRRRAAAASIQEPSQRSEIPDSYEEAQVGGTQYTSSLPRSLNRENQSSQRKVLFSDRVIPDSQEADQSGFSELIASNNSPNQPRGSASQIDSRFASPFDAQPDSPDSAIEDESPFKPNNPSPGFGRLTLANLELLHASVEVIGGSFPRPVSELSQTPASETSSELLARAHDSGHELLFETQQEVEPFIRDNSAQEDEEFDNLVQ